MSRRIGLWPVIRAIAIAIVAALYVAPALSAPYAAMVMDARTGEVLHSRNADTRLHPASLTKMMTLYVVFDAIQKGELTLDTRIRISAKAAAEPPSKLGLRQGSRMTVRHLIRAAAVKSANDAATALGEAVSGSEAAFARRMTATAQALGMTSTTFKNAHGLTESGHMSTARDMTTMGRRLFYDFPQYYNIFSRRTTDAGIAEVRNTNRRLLNAYRGADGIKTGYTRAAGFNLVASAERGSERIIATVFGGRSTATRNARVAELLDMGFERAPANVREQPPLPAVIEASAPAASGMAGKTIRVSGLVTRSVLPAANPRRAAQIAAAQAVAVTQADAAPGHEPTLTPDLRDEIDAMVAEVVATPAVPESFAMIGSDPLTSEELGVDPIPEAIAATVPIVPAAPRTAAVTARSASMPAPVVRPAPGPQATAPTPSVSTAGTVVPPSRRGFASALGAAVANLMGRGDAGAGVALYSEDGGAAGSEVVEIAAATVPGAKMLAAPEPTADPEPVIVTSLSTSSSERWGVRVGWEGTAYAARQILLKTAISEPSTLGGTLRKVVQRRGGFEANFLGMSEAQATRACDKLQARGTECEAFGPPT